MKQTTEQLIAELREMADRIEKGDSFEGNIQYEFEGNNEWEVAGAYRVGNSLGQGGMRLMKESEQSDNILQDY